MPDRLPNRRGPITLLIENRRLRWLVIVGLTATVLAVALWADRTQFRDLPTRLSRVSPGMTRAQVEELFGPPDLFLEDGGPGQGGTVVWVDQLWQVDVILDDEGRVLRSGRSRSDSALNRAFGRAPLTAP